MAETDGDPVSENSLEVPTGEKVLALVEKDEQPKPATEPKTEEVPGWANGLSDRMAALERRIPEPRAESPKDDTEEDDGVQIVSIEEIKDAVEDAVEKIPEVTHSLFKLWGGRKNA